MATQWDYGWALGFNNLNITTISSLIAYPPRANPVPLGSVERQTADSRVHTNGLRIVEWEFDALNKTDFQTLIYASAGSFENENTDMTIYTRMLNDEFGFFNAIMVTPKQGTHYRRRGYGDVEDLRIPFHIIEALQSIDGGLLLETGIGLQLETGDFLLRE